VAELVDLAVTPAEGSDVIAVYLGDGEAALTEVTPGLRGSGLPGHEAAPGVAEWRVWRVCRFPLHVCGR